MSQQSTDEVILIHGIWMIGLELLLLGRRLRQQGFRVRYFRYRSLFDSPQKSVERLADYLRAMKGRRAHIVAHSLGGIITLRALSGDESLPHGRMVFIGTPARGSRVARRLLRLHLGWLMGGSRHLFSEVTPTPQSDSEIGLIAGDNSVGIGRLFGGMDHPNDGTVAVAETMIPGCTDQCVVHGSHLAMLLMPGVSVLVGEFLRDGCFKSCPRR